MADLLREFRDAILVSNVVARVKFAKNFPNDKALKEYLSKHPNADKAKHKVVEEDKDLERIKKELKPHQDIWKGQEKSEKAKAKRKEEKSKKDEAEKEEKLRADLKKHQEEHPEGSIRSKPKEAEPERDETEEEGNARRKRIEESKKK